MEESGWQIDNVKLFRMVDNPQRPNDDGRQNINMVFIADGVSQVPSDSEEVIELKWFDLDKLPPKNRIAFDFYDVLTLYKKYLKEKFPLPVLG
jgi:8-oxo-dGTP diphosphatase